MVMKWFNGNLSEIPLDENSGFNKKDGCSGGLKSNIARSWMSAYFQSAGEKLPLKSQIALASFLTKKKVYQLMQEELSNTNDEILSYSRFCRLWKEEYSFVIIPPVFFFIYYSEHFQIVRGSPEKLMNE